KKLTNKFCECSKLSRIECDDIAQYVSFEPNYTQFSNYKTNSLNSSQFEELLQKNEENAPTLDNQFIGMIVYTMKEVNEQIEFKSRGIRKKSASSSHDTVGKGSILEGSKTNYIATELEVADINIYCWSPVVITSKFQFMLKNKKNITPWHEDILYLTLDKENQFVVECSFLGFSGEKITRTLDPSVAYTSPSDLDKKDFQEEILSQVGMHPQLSKKTSVYKEAVYSRLKHRASQLKNNFKEYISPISYIKIHKDLEKLDVSINLNNIPLFEHALFMFSGKTFINLPYFSSSTKVNHSSSFIDNIPCMKIEFKIKDKMKNDFIPVFNELKNFLSKQELDELILVESSVKDNVFTLHLNLTYIQANMPALQNIMNDLLKNGKSSYKKVYNEYREENINVKPALNFKTRKFKKLGLECIDDQSKKSKFLGAVLLKMFNAQHPCHFARISMYEKKIGFFAYFSLFQFDVFITEKEASVLLKNINQWIEKEESHLAKASFSKNNITHYHPLNPQLIISSEPVEKLKDGIIYLKPELNSLLSWNYSVSINDNIESGTIKLNQIKEKCRPENLELLTAIEKNKVLATLPVLSRLKHEIADVVFQAERSVFSFTLDQRILSSSTFIDTIKNILQSKPLELSSYYAKDNPISSFNINKLLLGLTSACRNHLEILAKSSSIIINEHDVITFFNLYVIGNMSLSYKDIQWLNRTDWLENQEQKTSWGFILKCIYFCNLLLAEASLKSTDSLYTIYQHTAKQLELEDSDLKISLEQWLNKEYNNLIENNTPKKIIDSL
ncbi:MAG: hypothetical protein HYX60_09665, partial [Legionella longbeachae]|nr:hypothetical protein [Legionella longbeachae]